MDSYVSDSGPKPLRALTSLLTSKRPLTVYKTAFWQYRKEPEQSVVLDKDIIPANLLILRAEHCHQTHMDQCGCWWGEGERGHVGKILQSQRVKSSLNSRAIESRQ